MSIEKSSKFTIKFLGDMFTDVHEDDDHEIMPSSINVNEH
jgi:hypothetical protein